MLRFWSSPILPLGWEYDSAGNVIEDGGSHHLRWDAAGRLIELGPVVAPEKLVAVYLTG
ncbi:MAG: RHS repeat domain-containing protein [Acidobacteriota bacterium]